MGHLRSEDSGPTRTLMDANHGDSHGPGTVANGQLHILIMSFHVFFHHAVLNDQIQGVQDVLVEFAFLQAFVEWSDISLALDKSADFFLLFSCLWLFGLLFFHALYGVLPETHNLPAPNDDHAGLLFNIVRLALVFKLAYVKKFLVILFTDVNHLGYISVSYLQVVGFHIFPYQLINSITISFSLLFLFFFRFNFFSQNNSLYFLCDNSRGFR